MKNLEPKQQAAKLLVQIHSEFGCEWNVQNQPLGFYQAKKETAKPVTLKEVAEKPSKALEAENMVGAIEAIKQAELLAIDALDLDSLRLKIESFNGCESLRKTATRLVFGDGASDADIMIIGEAARGEEDRIGKPFVGTSGRLLDEILSHVGLSRSENCYFTNLVFWRPAGNRPLRDTELSICAPFLRRQIELVNPRLLLLIGDAPSKRFFNKTVSIAKTRGIWGEYEVSVGCRIPMLATFHPGYLQQRPLAKSEVWEDIRSIRMKLDKISNDGAGGGT